MIDVRHSVQKYIDWVIRLGRLRFSILGIAVLAVFALCVQILLSIFVTGQIYWMDIIRSISFGLISAPFVIYFFNVIVEKLERSRQRLHESNQELSKTLVLLEKEIKEKNKAQLALQQKADFLRSFIDASPDLVFSRSENGKFLECNRAMELLTGKSESDLKGLTIAETFPKDIAKYIEGTDKAVLENNIGMTYEQWFKYPNGKLACFEIRKVPYYDQINQQHCLLGFGRDITEHKRYQETIEKANRDKSTLMATISHELRTPLNGIIGLSRILLDSQLNEKQRNYLHTINVSAVSLGHIFSDIIDLEKLDSRRIQLYKKETDVLRLLSDIDNFATFMANQKNLYFKLEYDDNLPNFLMLDYARISQILWNLINNAVKFTTVGGLTLRFSRLDQQIYSFALTDTGVGIPQSEQKKIFAMYYQVRAGNQKALGSGIGLSISKRIAKLMNGNLTVQSEPGKGSTFTFTFKAEEAIKLPPIVTIPELQHLSILLVEDIEINVIVARSVLEKLGYQVDVAMTGKDAIKMCEEKQYDLVLLDIHLPDMTGFEVAEYLHQQYEQEKYDYLPPLVALTANVVANKQDYFKHGMDDVLQKPLSLDALNQCLLSLFDLQPQTVESEESVTEPTILNKTKDSELWQKLDVMMLNELSNILGKKTIQNNLNLFSSMMPDYMQELVHLAEAYHQDHQHKQALCEIAHKIKGAASSVGLKQLQEISKHIQDGEEPDWEQHLNERIEQLQQWQQHTEYLQHWLDQKY
ncbi:aerobic respiration control protein [Gallibacterium salpingitidis]|uniref:Aerobic respiration control sensor protein n=1 Tax=Gallibacterium salpingitidis TaxID=505341 RepID=A0AB36E4M0_9PAST|nr:ATP-binding protein [Gallibacterium salpingitidis]OBX08489.1 aerobic respiration control protein [Gallibacterium salpingitidis]OBX11656.1 aerobic respiration control protein [Gallibacterium salpingitidis]